MHENEYFHCAGDVYLNGYDYIFVSVNCHVVSLPHAGRAVSRTEFLTTFLTASVKRPLLKVIYNSKKMKLMLLCHIPCPSPRIWWLRDLSSIYLLAS